MLEVAVGGVGAGEEHVGGDVAEVGPELVKGLGAPCWREGGVGVVVFVIWKGDRERE